jgi:hypothetical protein
MLFYITVIDLCIWYSRNTKIVTSKTNIVIEKIRSIGLTSEPLDTVHSLHNSSLSVADKGVLISGLKQLVLNSSPLERIRLLTICPIYW